MNTGRLKELIEKILWIESEIGTQEKLQRLSSALGNVVNQPQNPQHQTELAKSLEEFSTAMRGFSAEFTPQEFEHALELGGDALSHDLVDDIAHSISQNPMSPNVVHQIVQEMYGERENVFQNLSSIKSGFDFFEIGYSEVDEGMAELGFQIPRNLFDNDLGGLIDELSELQHMLRFFSEATIGTYEPAKVGEISTSDPLIFLSMVEIVAVKIGSLVHWALTVWVGVETIRHLRATTAKAQVFSEDEIEDIFGSKITEEIDKKVDEKVSEILNESKAPAERKGELEGRLQWALKALLAKVERGMTVELRISPPPLLDTADDKEDEAQHSQTRDELKHIQEQLVFPEASDAPILEIPHKPENDNE